MPTGELSERQGPPVISRNANWRNENFHRPMNDLIWRWKQVESGVGSGTSKTGRLLGSARRTTCWEVVASSIPHWKRSFGSASIRGIVTGCETPNRKRYAAT